MTTMTSPRRQYEYKKNNKKSTHLVCFCFFVHSAHDYVHGRHYLTHKNDMFMFELDFFLSESFFFNMHIHSDLLTLTHQNDN